MATIARIATVSMDGRKRETLAENRQTGLDLLDQALDAGCDLAVLPEAFPLFGLDGELADLAEPLDGPTVRAAAQRAREHRCYVCCPIKRSDGGRFYNSAVMLDRRGEILGVYDKLCPVTHAHDYTTFEGGVTPGAAAPVFELDFGPVGVQICFDLGFEENWQALADAGARLVLWPSAYSGGFPLRAFAYLHHYYVISSARRGRSRIIDPLGAVLDETTASASVLRREINLDYVVYHKDWNQQVARRIQAAYGERVEIRESDPDSGHVLVAPADRSITCPALQKEFGFEGTRQYHDRHRSALAELRAGRPPAPQAAAHGDRPQYG